MKQFYHFIGMFLLLFSTTVSSQGLITKQAPLPCLNKEFTIVAHIVRDTLGNDGATTEEIEEGIAELNIAFQPICATFSVCEVKYIDNFQYNILDRMTTEWDEMQVQYNLDNRINMYFIEDVIETPAICGFANLGAITQMEDGGIVILKNDCLTAGTIIHEMGHYFGLKHTFEGNGSELVDGSNCETEGDEVCDTPADPFTPGDPVGAYVNVDEGCRFISQLTDTNGQFYSPDVGNYMSYYQSSCSCGFTYQQFFKMANNYLTAPNMW